MPSISRKYTGRSAAEIYVKVDEVMARLAERHGLDYVSDDAARTGKVSKMGIVGAYLVKDGEVTVDLKFPLLVPGSIKREVEEAIHKKLDGLFA